MADGGEDPAPESASLPRQTGPSESADRPAAAANGRRASNASQSTDATEIASRQSSPASQSAEANVAASENPTGDAASATTNGTTASPYGTRSRNRNTASRPNYAEDTEMEFEMTGPPAKTGSGDPRPISPTQPTSETAKATAHNTRRASIAVHGAALTNGTHTVKETAPHKPAPVGENTVSRKRKAGASTASSQTTSQPPRKPGYYYVPLDSPRNGTNMVTFTITGAYLTKGKLKADDGTFYSVNDTVYLVCEPPGEPYYMGRIMEFLHANNDHNAPVEMLRMNWFYRPRDISRKSTDTRYLFATMHSETSPLSSLRGKCNIIHKSEIDDIDEFRKNKDSFWYDKLFDRYIMRFYDVIPTSQVVNVPPRIKKVLDEQWKFLAVEPIRAKELTSAAQSCKRCSGFCASNDSVECAVCHQTYHMNCVRPPLLKKPTRGFAWACAPCNRAQERKLEARNTPVFKDGEDEVMEDEEEEAAPHDDAATSSTKSEVNDDQLPVATASQKAQAKLWPFRYLGIHCKVEDILDFDDRIYPRASSRLGPRHQAVMLPWYGRPFELVKTADIKRKYVRGNGAKGRENKLTKETMALLEAAKAEKEKRPKWVIDAPPGYIERGEDHANTDPAWTAYSTFRIPEVGELQDLSQRGDDPELSEKAKELHANLEAREKAIDDYMVKAKLLAPGLNVPVSSTNFLTKAIELLYKHQFEEEAALKELRTMRKKADLKEPEFKPDEVKRFEEGVAKFGTDLRSVQALVKSQKIHDIIRYYYVWKKTERGKLIWGNFEGRRNKKESKRTDNAAKVLDDVADDQDDSAFDDEKIAEKKRGFQCKFCNSRQSRHWRRAPGVPPGTTIPADPTQKPTKDKSNQLMLALCHRCAELWRRYGLQWEDLDEVARKVAQGGGRAWRRRIDEEMLKELAAATDPVTGVINPAGNVSPMGPIAAAQTVTDGRKRQKLDGPPNVNGITGLAGVGGKKKADKLPVAVPQPVAIEPPKPKALPCAICKKIEPQKNDHFTCKECRLTVHRDCYGVSPARGKEKWTCDMCANDKTPMVSTSYTCVLCPVQNSDSQKALRKKTDKDKDRADREAEDAQRQRQLETNKPDNPREPLKATAGNNWVHVMCAVWTPEIKFGNAETLEPVEGIGHIPAARFEAICKFCKIETGACVPCHTCHATMHVTCAQKAGCIVGFDITPVKSTRRDHISTVKLGEESGVMTAAVWCKEHPPKNSYHTIDEVSESGINSLQLFVRTYRQADLTLTGTVRKASLANQPKSIANAVGAMRRASTVGRTSAISPNMTTPKVEEPTSGDTIIESVETVSEPEKRCVNCGINTSPQWYPASTAQVNGKAPENGDYTHVNGNGNHRHSSYDSDATQLNGASPQIRPMLDTSVGGRAVVICHKCHWRKKNGEPPISYEPSEAVKALTRQMPRLRSDSTVPAPTPTPPPSTVIPTAPPPPQTQPQPQSQPQPPLRATPPFLSQPQTPVWAPPHPAPAVPTYPRWQQPLGPHNPPPHMNGHPPPPQPPAPPQMHGLPHQAPSYSYAGPAALPPRERQSPIPPSLPPHPLSVSLPARRDYGQPSSYAMAPQQQHPSPYAHAPPPPPPQHTHHRSHSHSHSHSQSPPMPQGQLPYAHSHSHQHHHQGSPTQPHHQLPGPPPPAPHMSQYSPEPPYAQRSPYNGDVRGGYTPDSRARSPSREDERRNGTPSGSGGASAKASLANLLS